MRLAVVVLACALFSSAALAQDGADCTFSRGTNVCTSSSQRSETTTRTVYGGCNAGPSGQPGRRVTTYDDTYLVTTTTTTYQHGRNGKVYDSSTSEERVLQSSVLVSQTCEPL